MVDMIRIHEQVDHGTIIDEYQKLEANIIWTEYGNGSKQAGLQYKTGDDPWTSAVGKNQGKELSYDILNPFFEGTIFETLIEKYQLKRTRLMWVAPRSSYSMHKDSTPRLHIPLVTNPDCYFVFKYGKVLHLSAGNAYWVNTKLNHTFINCSEEFRLHLVGVVSE